MPGGFNTNPQQDGGWAVTESNTSCGMVIQNESRWPASAPGGSGVLGVTHAPGAAGVFGANNAVDGNRGVGVHGNGPEAGVSGWSEHGTGVLAQSAHIGLTAQGPVAAHFTGTVEVFGDIKLVGGDCAEEFPLSGDAAVEPGSVMVLDDHGGVRVSDQGYDRRVVGIVSGAGSYQPALVLDRKQGPGTRLPLALMGKVYCKVDASDAPVAVGDLLTTSPTPGHAMKAIDQQRAFGSVIGKAMEPCQASRGLIAVLVSLQ